MARFFSTEFGFTRARNDTVARFPYSVPEQLVGLRLQLLIDPELSRKEPGFAKVAFTSALSEWNKTTIKCRLRVLPGFECIARRTLSEPCHTCPVGFLRCRAATHRQDWIIKHCPHCDTEAWIDPEVPGNICVACRAQIAYERKE